jgi:hypothetical protein
MSLSFTHRNFLLYRNKRKSTSHGEYFSHIFITYIRRPSPEMEEDRQVGGGELREDSAQEDSVELAGVDPVQRVGV